MPMHETPTVAVVLAAGRGTRMHSSRPKVLHEAGGKPLLGWVLEAARAAGCGRALVVVGHGADEVRAAFSEDRAPIDVEWVEQEKQRGTGDALARAVEALDAPARLLVLSGDVPLVRGSTLTAMLAGAPSSWALAVADLAEPGSLGRVIAAGAADGESRRLARIVEAADATSDELAVTCVNAGIYVLESSRVGPYLAGLGTGNAQGELYLTDALNAAAKDGVEIDLFQLPEAAEAFGVNDRVDLARVHRTLLDRKCAELMAGGVTILEPARTVIEADVTIGADSVIHPNTTIGGASSIGAGTIIHAGAWIRNAKIGDRVEVAPASVIEDSSIESGCRVGPFARLRPGAELGEGSKVGNFVEIKNSKLGRGVKAGHLAYLGDAEIGDAANIGAGAVTCNYDGTAKHRTEVGERAFIGSDTMLVAPVKVGEGATTAAGSVITRDVPDGGLGVARERQRNIEGWSERLSRRRKRRSED